MSSLSRSNQIPRRVSHAKVRAEGIKSFKQFDYDLDFAKTDFRARPDLYRVGRGEQGVLLVQPYKSELLPHWRFKTPEIARQSAAALYEMFLAYRDRNDFVGMDMARKYLQMGYTRSRRYANHHSGRKYASDGRVLPPSPDPIKAKSAELFREAWKRAEADPLYAKRKAAWKSRLG